MGGFAVQSALRPSSQPSLSPSHLQVCLFFICMHWRLLVPWLLIGIPSTASFWGPGTAQAAPASRDLKTAMALSTECFQTFRMLALLGKAGRCLALHCVFSVFSKNQINFSLEESWFATSLLWFSSRPSSIWVPEHPSWNVTESVSWSTLGTPCLYTLMVFNLWVENSLESAVYLHDDPKF